MRDPRQIDLNLLVVFNEIVREQQISNVAKKLKLSQPAVSNALTRLRRTFDDPLFVRTKEGMQPTPFAEHIAEPIRLALEGLTQAINIQEQFDALSSQRHFVIALTDVAELFFMPQLIQLCARHAPHMQISTVRTTHIDLMFEMGTGKIDLAIGAFQEVSEALFQRRLFRQPYVVLMRAGHPLARRNLTEADFFAAEHLKVDSHESPYDRVNQDLEKSDISHRIKFSVPHFTAVPHIIQHTDLLVTVPQKLAEAVAQPFQLIFKPAPFPLPTIQTNIFWHRRFQQDHGNRWLREKIVELFSDASFVDANSLDN